MSNLMKAKVLAAAVGTLLASSAFAANDTTTIETTGTNQRM